MAKIKSGLLISVFIIALFIAACSLYIGLDGMPLTHPGNIKAADPFYHAIAAESIIETQQWNYYDYFISLGQEKASNVQPPLFYMNAAVLTLYSHAPAWATLYFLICIAQAFSVILVYLITKELFDKEEISIISSILAILPIPVFIWSYALYIGLWIQVASYFFILSYIWLFIRHLKREETWTLFFMSLCISAVLLLHPQDLGTLILPTAILGIKQIYKFFKKKDAKDFIINGLASAIIPAVLLLALAPKIIYVWGAQGSGQYAFGIYGFRDMFPRSYLGGTVYPDIFFFPLHFIILFLIGFVLILFFIMLNAWNKLGLPFIKTEEKSAKLCIKKESDKKLFWSLLFWICLNAYYLFITYFTEYILFNPHYFGRMRALSAFFAIPTIAFFIYLAFEIITYIILQSIPKAKYSFSPIIKALLILVLLAIVLFQAIPEYNITRSKLNYEHISKEEWNSYLWIQQNTKKTDKVFFFGSVFQSEYIYTKRATGVFEMNEMQKAANEYRATNKTPILFKGNWGADALRAVHKYEKSFFEYGNYSEPNSTLNILEFDYVVFQDIGPEVRNVNRFFAGQYISNFGFVPVYDKDGYLIIKNDRK